MKLTIDGREIVCRSGLTILEAARGAGISIPSLCDHPDLAPFAGCRICLVEVSGRQDPVPACATPVEEGLAVKTGTPEIAALRKNILELILAEHPYACLVCAEKATCEDLKSTIRKVGDVTGCVLCPQDGDCELQRVVREVGLTRVDLPAIYRDQDVRRGDPFFDRDHNLCILCGRCVRVCEEVRGATVLSYIHRGDRTEVGTAFDRPLLDSGCRFCGACVDICPTGALVERAVRPQARADRSEKAVCPLCGQGCVLELGIREDRVLWTRPAAAAPNQGQACVKGRFLVRGALSGPGRILDPHVRKDGRLVPVTFDEALDKAASGLEAASARRALVYPAQVPLEDAFLFLEFGREVLKAGAVAAEPVPALEIALDAFAAAHGWRIPSCPELAEIGKAGAIVALDIDLPADHPIAWLEVVRAVRKGAGFIAAGKVPAGPIGGAAVKLDFAAGSERAAAALAAAILAAPAKLGAGVEGFDAFRKSMGERGAASRRSMRSFEEAASVLTSRGPAVILFDVSAASGPSGPASLAWLWNIALLIGARLIPLARGANERGIGELERAVADPAVCKSRASVREGLAARAFDALYLAGPAPDLGDGKPFFLLCQDTHWNRNAERADVVLPAAAFAETGGTWINAEGRVRTCRPAVPAPGAARPDGEILQELARRMGCPGFARRDATAVLDEIRGRVPLLAGYDPEKSMEKACFLGEEVPASPRFVAVAPRVEGRARRAAARPAPEPEVRRDVLRGHDLIAGSRGYAKMRRVG